MNAVRHASAKITRHAARPETQRAGIPLLYVIALGLCLVGWGRPPLAGQAHALSTELQTALQTSRYVYIASSRKDGSYGKPAEIWFMYHQGAVWVASSTTSWRARRIRAGRPRATIAVGRVGGPTFTATGAIVADQTLYNEMYRTFARKYPDGWPKYEKRFRDGLADGTRVLIRYQPLE